MAHSTTPRPGQLAAAAVAILLASLDVAKIPAQIPQMHAGLAGQLRQFEPRVIAGRIVAVSPNMGRNMSSSSTGSGRRERLTIRVQNGVPSVNYELETPNEQISFEIDNGDHVTLRRQQRTEQGTVLTELCQIPGDPIVVVHGPAEATKKTDSPTLWHLYLADPELFRQQIAPLLELMRPGWPLAQLGEAIEDTLCHADAADAIPEQDDWDHWVAQLGSNRYAQRQAADRHLRASGPHVVAFLERLKPEQLDAEQSRRVREIIRALGGDEGEDVPQRVSQWLVDDWRVWYELLAREDAAKRRRAVDHLSRLMKGPIEFDPDATPEVRLAQRDALARQIADTAKPLAQQRDAGEQ